MDEQNEEGAGKRRLTVALGIVFAFLFALTWSLPSGIGWIFLLASGYCFFLYWYRLPKTPKIRLEVEDEEGRRFEYQTTEQRTQALVQKVVRIVSIGSLAVFFLLMVIGFFSSRDQASESQDSSEVTLDPEMEDTEAWNATGFEFYRSQQFDSALYYYERVLSKESGNATALYYKGLVYYDQQRMDIALESFARAHNNGMRDAFLSHVLAYLYDNNGNTSRAIGFYKEAVGMDCTRVDIYVRLAELEPSNAAKYKELEARFKN